VASNDTIPPLARASDDDRDNVIEILRAGASDGRISDDTFIQRVDIALRARGIEELATLLRDLPAPPPRGQWLIQAVRSFSMLGQRMQRAWRTPRLQPLVLPRGNRVFVIGRSPDSDLALSEETVSWRHAELRSFVGQWMLVDLGSTNGTYVNGWRAGSGFAVQPGDRVRFGTVSFLLTS
jgi:hypothetical protein